MVVLYNSRKIIELSILYISIHSSRPVVARPVKRGALTLLSRRTSVTVVMVNLR